LKPANLLVDDKLHVKVADFGFALFRDKEFRRQVRGEEGKIIGTPLYMSPQLLDNERKVDYFACDVYALGMVMWEVFTSMRLFAEYSDLGVFTADICDHAVRPPVSHKPTDKDLPRCSPPTLESWAPPIPSELVQLTTQCWSGRESHRPKMDAILHVLNQFMMTKVSEPSARQFWVDRWSVQDKTFDTVTWDDFRDAIGEETGARNSQIDSLQEFIATGTDAGDFYVTLEDFNQAVLTFGPFYNDAKAFQLAYDIVTADWWFADADRDFSENQVRKQDGLYLVRHRTVATVGDGNAPFALTAHVDGKITNRLVNYNPFAEKPQFKITHDKKVRGYDSLADLLADKTFCLKKPCEHDISARAYDES
jgi:serine/threonine protein kinase